MIDDEPIVGASIVRVLRRSHDATHHESALRAGERFDLILCDLTMPQMSGEQFYMALREEFPAMLERVVITTGGAYTLQAQQFLAREAPRVLEKPIDATRLRALVRSFLPAD